MEIVEFADPTPLFVGFDEAAVDNDGDNERRSDDGLNCVVETNGGDIDAGRLNDMDTIRCKFRLLYCRDYDSDFVTASDCEETRLANRSKCYEAFDDLCTLGVVCDVNLKKCTIRLDVDRLYNIGYVLMYDIIKCIPIFIKCVDLSFMYNCILYMSDCVYVKSFESYRVIKIKQNFTS